MYITDNRANSTVKFGEIREGDVFFSPVTNRFYICTRTVYSNDEECYDAVDLEDGYLVYFDDDENVEKVRANINITNP